MKYLIALVLLFIGCERQAQEPSQYQMTREKVAGSVYRIENDEAICYYEYDGGMDCKWKEKK